MNNKCEITCSSKNSNLFLTPYIKVTSAKRLFFAMI